MRSSIGLTLVLCLILALPGAQAVAGTPTEVVKGTVDEVLQILSNPALKAPSQRLHRLEMVKQAVDRHFDYEEMAKRSLGHAWRNLSRAQQTEVVELFGELLEASYADKIERYTDEKVIYLGESEDGDYAEVRTVVVRRNDRIPIDYRLHEAYSGWMVYDVCIEGVSLVSNYRSQFRRIIQESSYAELVRRLRVKVYELRELKKI
jgi:phospholipid transport system substrate-binding protein